MAPAQIPPPGALSRPGMSSPLRLEYQRCCLCGTEDAAPVGVGEDFEYRTSPDLFLVVQCRRCDVVYLSPRPAIDEMDRIYPTDYHAFQFSPEEFGLVHAVRRTLEARRLLRCCQGLPADARILDVGCGDGFHLRLLRDFGSPGWHLEGIDVSQRAAEAAKRAGLLVHQGTVEDADLAPGSYDLAFLIATIEHVADPAGVLHAVRRFLRPGGTAVVVTDSTDTLDFALCHRRVWGGYHFPRHWSLFNRKSLALLAAKSGMEVAKIESVVSPVNWVYSIRNTLVDSRAPHWPTECFSLKAPVALGVFTMVDAVFHLFGRGALLRMTVSRPHE
jgi:SAM-dependent methyltransferase